MNKTQIEWAKNPDGTQGYTWNPITGCLNHVDGLCKGGGFPCYAYKIANGRVKNLYLANGHTAAINFETCSEYRSKETDPFYPRIWSEKLYEPKHGKGGKGIFACDMSDLFGIGVPEMWTKQVMTTIELSPQHRFYLLTKQPQNLAKFSPFPDNCWVGVTATTPSMFVDALAGLRDIEAKIKYVSIEPYLIKIPGRFIEDYGHYIQWLIIGAQTKPYKPPQESWVREITDAAKRVGIPVFHKNNLPNFFDADGFSMRQEIP